MIGVFIVPTGIGAAIGGHAGDANPAAKLIASCCDKLITHPNVLNASDINEMTDNMLYVEGSVLDRFLQREICLKEVRQNKILVVANPPLRGDTINAVSAARVTIGIDVEILELEESLRMIGKMENNIATGDIIGSDELIKQVRKFDFDALAIHTPIEVSREVALNYYRNGGVNPWGGVEAKASKIIASALYKPVAHAPLELTPPDDKELFNIFYEEVDPRMAPEAISVCYLHSVLKGLHKAPRISVSGGNGLLHARDVDFMVTPFGCYGPPHEACFDWDNPVIVVKENRTVYQDYLPEKFAKRFIFVENYWEAAGVIMCMKIGIDKNTVRSPLEKTKVREAETIHNS